MNSAKKIKIGVFVGGQSAEHDVSLASGKNIAEALNQTKYEITLIAVDRTGVLRLIPSLEDLKKTSLENPIDVTDFSTVVALFKGINGPAILNSHTGAVITQLDVAFPILHGPFGEDGTLQGLLKFIGLPFAGPSVLGSAAAMDKDITKRLLRDAELPIGRFKALYRHQESESPTPFQKLASELGLPFFLKPANMGSSIGVHKVTNEAGYQKAIENAFLYDSKVIIEEFIDGREIECAVIGYHKLETSLPSEIIPRREFYSYEAKYLDENGSAVELPAKLTAEQTKAVQDIAVKVCKALECSGMSRVDCFVRKSDGAVLVNEINTLPGFTKISMYPKMMELTGRTYSGLIDELVEIAIQRQKEEAEFRVSV